MINIVCLLSVIHCVIYLGTGTGHLLVEDLATSSDKPADCWDVTLSGCQGSSRCRGLLWQTYLEINFVI